jgi:DMSO/TMAO reductase YedYZ molybdopterin-dependent catalytic subunit
VPETAAAGVTFDELRLAARNHAMPLEAPQYDVTPVGLHYLLIHYDIPAIDVSGWRLKVGGQVGKELELSLDDLRAMPAVTRRVTMECAGNGRALLDPRPPSQPWLLEAVGTGEWTGVLLADVLARAEPAPGAVEVVFTGADRGVEQRVEQVYERSLPVSLATGPDVLLAYALNGAPLPPQHGYPLRLVVAGWYGMTNVKWLKSVTVLDHPFTGYQMEHSYRLRGDEHDAGIPLTRMLPRALMVPPGIPEFLTRERLLASGEHVLQGRAWSGHAAIDRVEVSVDGGAAWEPAETSRDLDSDWAWCSWTYRWSATPGRYELRCRATDQAGNVQPLDSAWNVGGYANNSPQQVSVTVRAG